MAGRDDDGDDDEATYRSVEKAFVVHRQIEFGLDALDGHHTESHWDQVEHGCTNTHTRHTVNMRAHAANKHALAQRTWGGQRATKILINISVPSGMMTLPFCHSGAVLQGHSGAQAPELN